MLTLTDAKAKQSIKYNNFKIYYDNLEATLSTLDEVFQDNHYAFISKKTAPVIIDGGANIGLAALFFKHLYPDAKITCFEPDPTAYITLQTNIKANNLANITPINAALANIEGVIDFYGQILVPNPDARGNSIIESWGKQRAVSNNVKVSAVKLSNYIKEEIDLLKLDIEGAEQLVLEEIQDKLHWIKAIAMEIHESDAIKDINSLNNIIALLNNHGFKYEIIKKTALDFLPEQVKDWAIKLQPHLYTVKAIKV